MLSPCCFDSQSTQKTLNHKKKRRKMHQSVILLVAVVTIVGCVNEQTEFRRLINKSRVECRRAKTSRVIDSTCLGKRSLEEIVDTIPGGRNMVRIYAGPDLMKTYDLCVSRESGGSDDWKVILSIRNRIDAGATRRDEIVKECEAQIKLEKEDCAALKELVCAFSQGTDFTCAADSQKERKAATLSSDQCFHLSAIADDRPDSLSEFNSRLRKSRSNCRQDKDTITGKCAQERTLSALMRQVPKGVNVIAKAGNARSELRLNIERCLDREEVGFAQFRWQALLTLSGTSNRELRTNCLKQIQDEIKDCKEINNIVCAFTYGIDFSCAPDEQKRGVAADSHCTSVEQAIKTASLSDN